MEESAWGRLMRGFDEAIDFDKAFPLVLWKMLSAMQKKKASPNGTGNLIAVEPRVAAELALRFYCRCRSEHACHQSGEMGASSQSTCSIPAGCLEQ